MKFSNYFDDFSGDGRHGNGRGDSVVTPTDVAFSFDRRAEGDCTMRMMIVSSPAGSMLACIDPTNLSDRAINTVVRAKQP